jgi:hypothetical protein
VRGVQERREVCASVVAMPCESRRTLCDLRTRVAGSASPVRATDAANTDSEKLEPEGAASRGRLIPFGRMPGRPLSLR